MKIGDIVMHRKKKILGRVIEFAKKTRGVIVDFSDETGVMCRWVDRRNLEVVSENE